MHGGYSYQWQGCYGSLTFTSMNGSKKVMAQKLYGGICKRIQDALGFGDWHWDFPSEGIEVIGEREITWHKVVFYTLETRFVGFPMNYDIDLDPCNSDVGMTVDGVCCSTWEDVEAYIIRDANEKMNEAKAEAAEHAAAAYGDSQVRKPF